MHINNKFSNHNRSSLLIKRITSIVIIAVLIITVPFDSAVFKIFADEYNVDSETMSNNGLNMDETNSLGEDLALDEMNDNEIFLGDEIPTDIDYPRLSSDDKSVEWDTVYFGNYLQEDTNEDGVCNESDEKTPILWRVLEVNNTNGYVTLLSDKVLDCKQYYASHEDVTPKNSSVIKWLNNEFYKAAFSDAEQDNIIEKDMPDYSNEYYGVQLNDEAKYKVLLPDLKTITYGKAGFYETSGDGNPLRASQSTEWAKVNGVATNKDGNAWWWLGNTGAFKLMAMTVTDTGLIDDSGYFVDATSIGIRPMIYVKYSKNLLKTSEACAVEADIDSNKFFYDATVPSSDSNVSVEGINVSENDIFIGVDEEKKIEAIISPANATNKNLIWKSENDTIASVNNGTIKGIGVGETVVTVSTEDGFFSNSIKVKVHLSKINVTFDPLGGSVNKKSIVVNYGEKYGELPVATLNGKYFEGWYTAKEGGTKILSDTIAVSDTDITLYARYDCLTIVSKQKFDVSKYFNIPQNTKFKFEGKYTDDANKKKIKISKKGVLKADKAGTVEVNLYVKNGKKYEALPGSSSFVFKIVKPTVLKKYNASYMNQNISLTEIIGQDFIPSNDITVSVKNGKKEIATLADNQKDVVVTNSGKAKINIVVKNIQDNEVKYTVALNSKIPYLSVTDINLSLDTAKKAKKTISIKNVNKKDNIEWSIENPEIATLTNGKSKTKVTVNAKEAGETNIAAIVNDKKYTATVKVSQTDNKGSDKVKASNESISSYVSEADSVNYSSINDSLNIDEGLVENLGSDIQPENDELPLVVKAQPAGKTEIKYTSDDENPIPDKYSVGYRGDIKSVSEGENINGIQFSTRSDMPGNRLFYLNKQSSDGVIVIKDRDFSDLELKNSDAGKCEKNLKVIFKNCNFSLVNLAEDEGKVIFEFDNCTLNHVSGSNIILRSCSLGNSAKDALNPFRNVFMNRTYISNLNVYKEGEAGSYHSDAIQMYGREDSKTHTPTIHVHNVEVYNSRIEVPTMDIPGSGAYVNACFMVQLEYANADNVHFDNCVINGGGYSIYSHPVKNAESITNLTYDNIRIGGSRSYGALYPDEDRNNTKGVFTNISESNSLYVGSTWKDNSGTHLSITNDTLSERKLLIITDKGEFNTTVKPAFRCIKNKNETSHNYGDEVVTSFAQLPIDIDYVIKDDISYAICFDVTNDKFAKQVRFVNFSKEKVYMDEEKYNSLIPQNKFELLSGNCGKDVTFNLTSDFVLTIEGTGDISGFGSTKIAPWEDYKGYIKEVVIKDGVTSIGANAFTSITGLEKVTVPDSVTNIGQTAFKQCVNLREIELPTGVTLATKKSGELTYENVFVGTTTVIKYR